MDTGARRYGAATALTVFLLAHILSSLLGGAIGPLGPFLQVDLGLSRGQIGLFTSALYLGAVVAGIPAGWLADAWGVRRMLLIGGLVTGGLVAVMSAVPQYWLMLVLFALAGIGYGIISPATTKGIMYWFDAAHRGTAMAVKQTGVTGGGMLAAAILPSLALVLNWRWGLALASLVTVVWTLASFALYRDPVAPETSAVNGGQKYTTRDVLRNRDILAMSLIGVFFASLQLSGVAYLSLYLVETRGLSGVAAGGFLALAQGAGVGGRLFWGWISDRFFAGRREVTVALIGFLGGGAAVLLGLGGALPWTLVGLAVALFGFTAIGYNAVFLTLISEAAGKELAGVATGLSLSVAYCGIIFGPPLFGLIVDWTGSYVSSWVGFGVALVLAAAALLWLRRRHGGPVAAGTTVS